MDAYLLDWGNLLLRWVHVITAIAWVGSSFYFVFLDNNLVKPKSPDLLEKGVDGAMWAVHGGGFYNPQKYMVAPKTIHSHLHWFYWESYSTWLSGFALFTLLYLYNASTYLIDKSLMAWEPSHAIAVALCFLVSFWLIYDWVCRLFGFRKNGEAIVGAIMLVVITAATWLACHWFAGRAAFLLVGAMIATAMSANVFFWIIPGQRTVVAAMTSGKPQSPEFSSKALAIHGKRGKQRSVHNTYFTLPVLFAMLSNHYSFTYTHEHNWLVLVLMMLAGAAIRQYFVLRHGFRHGRNGNPIKYAIAGIAVILAVIVWLAPANKPASKPAPQATAVKAPDTATILEISKTRCIMCHGAALQMKNIRLDSIEFVDKNAALIYQQAVVTKLMPINNATGITPAERDQIAAWFQAHK
ncbi:MAG: urate hydroxylase PuuD [Cytophagales bacterium]|nr:urate hydroxylase PuuD [Cytophagales bacterium]